MFILQIRECFLQKGVKPTVSALMRMGIAERSAYNYLNGTAKSIKPEHLYVLLSELHAERTAAREPAERGCVFGKPPFERLDEKTQRFSAARVPGSESCATGSGASGDPEDH